MAFNPSYNILDKDTHNTLVEALKSGGIGYTEADGPVHKISDTYGGGGGSSLPEVTSDDNGDVLTVVSGEWAKAAPSGGGGSGFDAVIKSEQDENEDWVYTLLEGSYSTAKAKLSTGVPVVLIGTYISEEVEGMQMVGYAQAQIGAIVLATYTGGECLMIGAGGTLYWLPDDTISEQPPEPPK